MSYEEPVFIFRHKSRNTHALTAVQALHIPVR